MSGVNTEFLLKLKIFIVKVMHNWGDKLEYFYFYIEYRHSEKFPNSNEARSMVSTYEHVVKRIFHQEAALIIMDEFNQTSLLRLQEYVAIDGHTHAIPASYKRQFCIYYWILWDRATLQK